MLSEGLGLGLWTLISFAIVVLPILLVIVLVWLLVRSRRTNRRAAPPSVSALSTLEGVPRYAVPAEHHTAAARALCAQPPDLEAAAGEAVAAVTALARIVLAAADLSLAECAERLEDEGRLHPALARSMAGLEAAADLGSASQHGTVLTASLTTTQTRSLMAICDAALTALLAIDGQGA